MTNKFIEPILIEVAKKNNLPLHVVKEIYESPFKFMRREVRKEDSWKTFLINGLGKFRPHNNILKAIERGQPFNFKRFELNQKKRDGEQAGE